MSVLTSILSKKKKERDTNTQEEKHLRVTVMIKIKLHHDELCAADHTCKMYHYLTLLLCFLLFSVRLKIISKSGTQIWGPHVLVTR